MSDGAMKFVIERTPRGEVPEWVRGKWIGSVLYPCYPPPDVSYGLRTGKKIETNNGFEIRKCDALAILAGHSLDAYRYWCNFFCVDDPRILTDSFVFDRFCGKMLPPPDVGDKGSIIEFEPPAK